MKIPINQYMYLTDEHPRCKMGYPVLIYAEEAYFPNEALPSGSMAGELVAEWGNSEKNATLKRSKHRNAAGLFCQQHPEGPQVEKCNAGRREGTGYRKLNRNISLTPEQLEKVTMLGHGNVSKGVQKCIDAYGKDRY